jgi:plastocyanin
VNPAVIPPVEVEITVGRYSPAEVIARVDQFVKWTNRTAPPHTIVFDDGTKSDQIFVSGAVSWSRTFSAAGTYPYHADGDPKMAGIVTVVN